jgi:ATP-binding cassette subfamily F protein uup
VYNGNYSDYRAEEDERELDLKKQPKPAEPAAAEADGKKKASFQEKKEYEQVQKELTQLEEEKKQLNEKMAGSGHDATALIDLGTRLQQVEQAIEAKMMRWMELEEKMES